MGPWLEALEDRMVPSTLTVTSAADDGSAGTLRAVLGSAHGGDTIRFAHQLAGQTITLTNGQLSVDQNLTIVGLGANKLTINGNASGRVFDIVGGTTATISGLTITGGLTSDGAGILNAGNLTLLQDVVSGNTAQGIAGAGLFGDGAGRGGGVENQADAVLSIWQSSFSGNQALGGPEGGNAFGGAIYNEAATVTINQSTFTANQALAANGGTIGVAATMPGGISVTLLGVSGGGAVWNDGGSLTVTNSALDNNLDQAGNNGDATASMATFQFVGSAVGGAIGCGAFFSTATPVLAINSSTLSGNLSVGGTNVSITGPIFFYSSADAGKGRGGAVGAVAGNVTVSGSAIGGNLAQSGALINDFNLGSLGFSRGSDAIGGGIDDSYDAGFAVPSEMPTLTILNSTLSGNTSLGTGPTGSGDGGGLNMNEVSAQITGSTASGNRALGGPAGGYVNFYGSAVLSGGGSGAGAGIDGSGGSLTISGSTIKNNLAQGGPGTTLKDSAGGGSGAGISSSGQNFVLVDSLLTGNQALGGNAISDSQGQGGQSSSGGLYLGYTSATIISTVFSNNLAQGGIGSNSGGGANGGAGHFGGGQVQMTNCLITGNEVIGGAGSPVGPGFGGIAGAGGLGIFNTNANISKTTFQGNMAREGPRRILGGMKPSGARWKLSPLPPLPARPQV